MVAMSDDDVNRSGADLPSLPLESLRRLVRRAAGVDRRGFLKAPDELPDPSEGALDRRRVLQLVEAAGEGPTRALLEDLKAEHAAANRERNESYGLGDAITLVEAALGWVDRKKLERAIRSRSRIAVQALGLMPLERGEDEALERYLLFQDFLARAKGSNAARRARDSAAYEAGMINLAQTAGHPDAARLELALELRLAERSVQGRSGMDVDGYRVQIELDVKGPHLTVSRAGKVLRSIPKGVRESDGYSDLQEHIERLRGQRGRVRAAIESYLASGDYLSREDVARLACLPAGPPLLRGTLFRAEGGEIGLLEPQALKIQCLDGNTTDLGERVRVAHPFDLHEAGSLAQWQTELVRRRVVQPCKQAFRELYLLNAAELQSRTESLRFAGHSVDGRIASRLLYPRGWLADEGMFRKRLPSTGLEVCFACPEAMTDYVQGRVTTASIFFVSHDGGRVIRKALAEIPARAFSEAMRDADLVVSVAHLEPGDTPSGASPVSAEAYERRADLIRALLADLGLPGVRVDGHFAFVEGKLASYRVHLASGAIHVDPGGHICVVPQGWGRAREDSLFLPFAEPDRADRTMVEIMSKILLLLADDKIEDPSILAQIRARWFTGPRGLVE